MSASIIFSASADGLEFLTITANGAIITRHRRKDGVVHWHRQDQILIPGFLHIQEPFEAWSAQVLPLPPLARTPGDPESIVVLVRPDYPRLIPFAFPFVALSTEAAERIVEGVPQILLLVHDSHVSCCAKRHEKFRERQSDC